MIAVACSVVLVVAVGAGVGLYMTSKAHAIGLGTGTATITWKPVGAGSVNATTGAINNPPQAFAGTIEGIRVSGSATMVAPPTSGLPPGGLSFPLQKYTGSFDGKHFDLEVTVSLSGSGGASSTTPVTGAAFVVNGTWGSDHVHAVVSAPTSANLDSAGFRGNVGQWKVTGTIHQPTSASGTSSVTADFEVSQ